MSDPRRWAGAYVVASGILAIVFAAAILTGPYRAVQRSDYMTYQTAVRIVLEARGDCLYTVACQSRAQRDLIGEEPSFSHGALPFNSPPWLAAVLVPLGPLPLAVAFALFTLLSIAALAVGVWRLAWGGAGTRLVATLLVLSAWPTVMAVIRGQSTLAVAGILGLSVASSLSGHTVRTGAYLGLAALKPTLMPVLSVRLLVERRWRALAAAAIVLVGLVVLAALVVSPKAVTDYPAYLLDLSRTDSATGVHVDQMINWRGAALRLGAGGSPLAMAGITLTLGLTAAAWWWARHSPRAGALGASISLIATPLVIPHANQHEAIVAMLGILLAVAALQELRTRLAAGAIAMQGLLWIGPVLTEEAGAWLLFLAITAWLIALVVLAWRERTGYFRPIPVTAGTD